MADAIIIAEVGSIDSITGDGWEDGLRNVIAVAHENIGSITGKAAVNGTGILAGSFDANYGSIGQITAIGGAAGGYGILETRFQATDRANGGIASLTASANANGLDAINALKAYASEIGPIQVTVHGGLDGNGIRDAEIRAFWGDIDSIEVNVRSINGMGIRSSEVRASGDIGLIRSVAFNSDAIFEGTFSSRGDYGTIHAESLRGGTAINASTFTAPDGVLAASGGITAIAGGSGAQDGAIRGSNFNADADFGGLGDILGNIGSIRVTVPGRNASGVVLSTFTGGSIGNISVRLADNALTAMDAIQSSTFTALRATIGDISVVNTGLGSAIANSLFVAFAQIGNITVQGDVVNTQFLVINSTIGDLVIRGTGQQSLTLNAGRVGNITIDRLAGTSATLALPRVASVGNVLVSGLFGAPADLVLVEASTLVEMGSLEVTGQLAIHGGLPSATRLGAFTAGSLATLAAGTVIGAAGNAASTIGPIRIGATVSGHGNYQFRFGGYGGNPNAVVGTASGNARTNQGTLVGGVRLILNQAGRGPVPSGPMTRPAPSGGRAQAPVATTPRTRQQLPAGRQATPTRRNSRQARHRGCGGPCTTALNSHAGAGSGRAFPAPGEICPTRPLRASPRRTMTLSV